MSEPSKTALYDRHVGLGAKMVEFAGWMMPLNYGDGIVKEHLATRKYAGLFDVSHMGRFVFRGNNALDFLQHVLTNNAAALDVGKAQYTIIPNNDGGAIDDAYLYRFFEDEYLLVVNAANRQKDWEHFESVQGEFNEVEIIDKSKTLAMLSLQGPVSKQILNAIIESGQLPEPKRNELSIVKIKDNKVLLARTGYTGEPLGFELFIPSENATSIWDTLIANGANPVGLGARDTLRLEAGLPLYGHELGLDAEGNEIHIFACPLAKFAVSFSPLKGDFIGRAALEKQYEAFKRIQFADYSLIENLPRMIMPLAVLAKNIARAGAKVFVDDKQVGYVTSGTSVPNWSTCGEGLDSKLTEEVIMRPVCLVLIDSHLQEEDRVQIEIRGKKTDAVVVPYHLRSEAPPYARAILYQDKVETPLSARDAKTSVLTLLQKTIANTQWRQTECVNLIPSEQTQSPAVRLLSVMDPAFRYAEHKSVKAFEDVEVFYYQGTDFIFEVERLLETELCKYLGCGEVETRAVSGQMANTIVFGAMVDFLNRSNRKAEPKRMRKVFNNDIIKGGHLSAQPMGALRDFVAHDPNTERPAVVNFSVLRENPYRMDVVAAGELIAQHKPELIILGKSLVLHPEPVSEIRTIIDELGIDCVLMYDMAHVLGIVGPYFQNPFKEGADIVTGSTHKTFFGTQRGVVAGDFPEHQPRYKLWEAIKRRAFPGAVSNHHLGTLLGLLMAAYEMNHFKDEYQQAVISNAKAFAKALKDTGLNVAGDPEVSYTQTHQVVINVGYGKGPGLAKQLEENNIIVNYQAGPYEEGFSAAGALRMGVAEMTRFGMQAKDFQTLAQLMHEVIVNGKAVADEVKYLRTEFLELNFCFTEEHYDHLIQQLHILI